MDIEGSESRLPATPAPMVPLLPYQREDVESPDRFRWNCWARQTGKSFSKSLRRLLRGLARRRPQVFLSAGLRPCAELMDKVRQHCQALRVACAYRGWDDMAEFRERRMEVTLPGGVRIIGLPANPSTVRGYTGDVLLDEFAMHRDAREVWAALFPTLLRGDGELDVASTPRGRGHLFYELSRNEMFGRSIVTLPEAIGQGLDADLSVLRQAMGDDELFRQEFLCEFLDESAAFLTHEQLRGCQDESCRPATTVEELAAMPEVAAPSDKGRPLFRDGGWYVGMDIGRKHDRTVFWVLAQTAMDSGPLVKRSSGPFERYSTVGVIELSNAPFAAQWEVLMSVLRLRRVRRCAIDASGIGMTLAEEAERVFGSGRVEGVTLTAAFKSTAALALRRLVEERRLAIPANDRVTSDWTRVERDVTPTGHFRLSAPRGPHGHADLFWAAVLAVHAAGQVVAAPEATALPYGLFRNRGAW